LSCPAEIAALDIREVLEVAAQAVDAELNRAQSRPPQ
jgi:hypothetical protein